MSEAALTRCPHCKGKVERLISAGTGFIFKGSGFYSTDYKKKPEAGSMKQEAGNTKPPATPATNPAGPSFGGKASPPEKPGFSGRIRPAASRQVEAGRETEGKKCPK